MRLWHWQLIDVLPRHQLLGQWRECCLTERNIQRIGYPNHILVNPVSQYNRREFYGYCLFVANEMTARRINVNLDALSESNLWHDVVKYHQCMPPFFVGWHTENYLKQCYYNLMEKWERGGIQDDEWDRIDRKVALLLRRKTKNTEGLKKESVAKL